MLTASTVLAADEAGTAEQRRAQLAEVQKKLTDPDPDMRQAYMEEIIASEDAAQIRIALRMAFTGDDQDLRATAMRGYLASAKEIVFDMKMPDAIQKQYDKAKMNPADLKELENAQGYYFINTYDGWHMTFDVLLTSYQMKSNAGKFGIKLNSSPAGSFTVVGDTVKGDISYQQGAYQSNCQIQFKPTPDLKLVGTLNCNIQLTPPITITAPLF